MSAYTPTIEEVLAHYTYPYRLEIKDLKRAEFDRWHAANNAQVLRDAAHSGLFGTNAQATLLRMAESIEEGAA